MARGRSVVRRTVREQRIAAAERSLSRLGRLSNQDVPGGLRGLTTAETERERAARLGLRQRAASASRSRARAAVGTASKGPTSGQYSSSVVQQTKTSSSARMGRKTTAAQTALKLTRSQLETVILRWNGIKAFDTNGKYFMQNLTLLSAYRGLPLYMFDLTAVRDTLAGDTYVGPFVQLQQTGASMLFQPITHVIADGTTNDFNWAIEKAPQATAPDILSKTMLKSLSIKMNCWGAKTKATTYTIQLVKFLDDELVPSHGGEVPTGSYVTQKRSDFYQNLIKSLTYNPIAQTGGSFKGRMKVLKSETFIIQPNDASDGDTDPNVRTVSMFVAMNRIISYQESAVTIQSEANTHDDADFAVNRQTQFKAQTRPKSRVYLMIRASNYKKDTADTNVDTPSFDLMIRANHQVTV